MVNILIFAPLSLEQGRGGELSVIELGSELKKHHHVQILDTNRSFGKELLSTKFINRELNGLKRSRIKYLKFSFHNKHFGLPLPKSFFKLLKYVIRNDIIYFSLMGIGNNILFIILSILSPRSKFIVGHRMPLYSDKKLSIYNERMKISYILFSIFKKRFFHHTLSYRRKKYLENFLDQDKVFHIRHCIKLDHFINEPNIYKKEVKLRFIYVGFLDAEDKGIDILIKGIIQFLKIDTVKDVFFEFCGTGPLEQEIKELEIKYPAQVKYNGYVNYDQIAKYYKRNNIFIFTSRREAFGRVIIEALASNLMILCSKTIGSKEILHNKEFAFFINKLTPLEIKDNLLKIYDLWKDNPDKFEVLKDSAKEYVIEKYSYSNELNGFLELFKQAYIN